MSYRVRLFCSTRNAVTAMRLKGLAANVVTMMAVSLATSPMDPEHVRQFVVE